MYGSEMWVKKALFKLLQLWEKCETYFANGKCWRICMQIATIIGFNLF